MKKITSILISLILISSMSILVQAQANEVKETETTEIVTEEKEPLISRENVENNNSDTPYPNIQQYLDEDAILDIEGNSMLVDRVEFESGDKELITIATRDGSVFYIIIDNTAPEGSNVFFLNKVDAADLMAIANQGSNTVTTTTPKVSEKVVGEQKKEEKIDVKTETNEEGEEVVSVSTQPVKKDNSLTLIIIMVVAIGVIGGGYWFFKIRPGKGQPKGFDDDFEDEDEDENINEDEDEDEDDE